MNPNFDLDLNDDGIPDSYAEPVDTDGDGTPDAALVYTDLDGDGNVDMQSLVFQEDIDGDGTLDTVAGVDGDLDGEFDDGIALDLGSDGVIDAVEIYTDGDGMIDQEIGPSQLT
jgi:large repetitive protein